MLEDIHYGQPILGIYHSDPSLLTVNPLQQCMLSASLASLVFSAAANEIQTCCLAVVNSVVQILLLRNSMKFLVLEATLHCHLTCLIMVTNIFKEKNKESHHLCEEIKMSAQE